MPKEEIKWGEILRQLESSSAWFRPKDGRTRMRLVLPPGESPHKFYREVQTSFQGNLKTRFMLMALLFAGEGVTEEMSAKVTPVIVAKTVLKGILSLLVEGYDLLGPEANGITIIRTGQGLNTDYSVMPSKNPIPLPENITYFADSFDEAAENFTRGALEMDKKRGENPVPFRGGPKTTTNLFDDADF